MGITSRIAALLAIGLTLGSAAGQIEVQDGKNVEIVRFASPSAAIVDRLFTADASIANHMNEPASVLLFVQLYRIESGDPRCDGEILGKTSNANKQISLVPGEQREVVGQLPGSADPWFQKITSGQAPVAGEYQLCAWLERSHHDVTRLYYDYAPSPIRVRLENALPSSIVTVEPERGSISTTFRFTAVGRDSDGDPVAHRWRFGDGETAAGNTTTHRYSEPGTYTVSLVSSDGFDETFVNRTLVVTSSGSGTVSTPSGATWIPIAASATLIRLRRGR